MPVDPQKIEDPYFWFSGEDKYILKDNEGSIIPHPFFDFDPQFDDTVYTLNYFVVNEKESPIHFSFDVLSGKTYAEHLYCDQKDVWKKYNRNIENPPFTEGVVPRVLDQSKRPQKIIVFGKNNETLLDGSSPILKQARVVGAYIEQYCITYPCTRFRPWVSRLVLVAVNPSDSKFADIRDFDSLKDKVNWDYTLAFIQNGPGVLVKGKEGLPAYRTLGEADSKAAFATLKQTGHIFNKDELVSMKSACQKLYSYFDFNLYLIKEQKKNLVELQKKIDAYNAQKFRSQEQELQAKLALNQFDKLKDQTLPIFFSKFYNEFGDRYKTCSKYVRTPTINHSHEKHWLFQLVTLFYRMEELQYFYSCSTQQWLRNEVVAEGKTQFDTKREYATCSLFQLESAFDAAIRRLTLDRSNGADYLRFIDYDSGLLGSKEKIYAWVNATGKRPLCRKDAEREEESENVVGTPVKINNSLEKVIFPEEVKWPTFDDTRDLQIREGLIR